MYGNGPRRSPLGSHIQVDTGRARRSTFTSSYYKITTQTCNVPICLLAGMYLCATLAIGAYLRCCLRHVPRRETVL